MNTTIIPQKNFPNKQFITIPQHGGGHRLQCPVCGKLSRELLSAQEVMDLIFADMDSICIDCTPAPKLEVRYGVVPNG